MITTSSTVVSLFTSPWRWPGNGNDFDLVAATHGVCVKQWIQSPPLEWCCLSRWEANCSYTILVLITVLVDCFSARDVLKLVLSF
jgi:hypothetical protein